jgi:hypothetical protein
MGGDTKYGSDRSNAVLDKAVQKSDSDLKRYARDANAVAGNKKGSSKASKANARKIFQAAVRARNKSQTALFRKMTGGKAKSGVGRSVTAAEAARAASKPTKKKTAKKTTARKPAKKKAAKK